MRSTVENEPFSFENYDYKSTFKKTRSERDERNEDHKIQLCNTNGKAVEGGMTTIHGEQ